MRQTRFLPPLTQINGGPGRGADDAAYPEVRNRGFS
jgi:hypothetical protein